VRSLRRFFTLPRARALGAAAMRYGQRNRHPIQVAHGLTTRIERSSKCDVFRVARVA
jgi:hypothetical protein